MGASPPEGLVLVSPRIREKRHPFYRCKTALADRYDSSKLGALVKVAEAFLMSSDLRS
jgi:hypothetical protein